jgi:hypothetical protein
MSNARELAELGGSYGTGGFVGMKNRIINGAMMIDQRNAGAAVTIGAASGTYTIDRWRAYSDQASKFSVQQNAGSVTPPVGFINYLGVTSLSAYSVGASEIFNIAQRVEGFNISDLAWGTANAQSVTLSFWVRSSLTGTFGGAFRNSAGNRCYPFSYTISSANTWEQKTVTVAGDTAGTWLTNNGIGILLNFSLGSGSSVSGAAGAWTSSDVFSATGATSVVGTNGATWYITGVQLEKGSTATSFDYRPYGTELALCQRYYQTINAPVHRFFSSTTATSGYSVSNEYLPVLMRATPSIPSLGTVTLVNISSNTSTTVNFTVEGTSTGSYRFYPSSGMFTSIIYTLTGIPTITLSSEL